MLGSTALHIKTNGAGGEGKIVSVCPSVSGATFSRFDVWLWTSVSFQWPIFLLLMSRVTQLFNWAPTSTKGLSYTIAAVFDPCFVTETCFRAESRILRRVLQTGITWARLWKSCWISSWRGWNDVWTSPGFPTGLSELTDPSPQTSQRAPKEADVHVRFILNICVHSVGGKWWRGGSLYIIIVICSVMIICAIQPTHQCVTHFHPVCQCWVKCLLDLGI